MNESLERHLDYLDSQQPSQSLSQTDGSKVIPENSNFKITPMKRPSMSLKKEQKNLSFYKNTEKDEDNNLDTDTSELMEAIQKLEEQLRSCTRYQRFIEAEEIKNKLRGMKLDVVIKKSREMETRHIEELNQIVVTQNIEMENFMQEWDEKIVQYKNEAKEAENEMIYKHNTDLNALEQDLRASIIMFLRTSPKILNLRKMIDTLAKQKEFVQADKLRIQCTKLEEEEFLKAQEQKENKIIFILTQLASKQKNELNGLKKRVSTGYTSLLKSREAEYRKLVHKLQNMKQVIENTQQLEFAKFEVAYKNYVPGETLKFRSRKRGNSISNLGIGSAPYAGSLNTSFVEGNKGGRIGSSASKKRCVTPMRKEFHIPGRPSTGLSHNRSTIMQVKPGRYISNPKERNETVA